jgi:hypothetical protein
MGNFWSWSQITIVAYISGNYDLTPVLRWARTEEMRWSGFGFKKDHKVPQNAVFHDRDGRHVDSSLWLNANNANRWELMQSAVYMPYYDLTLVLIHAERKGEFGDDWDEPDPTPPNIPSFR